MSNAANFLYKAKLKLSMNKNNTPNDIEQVITDDQILVTKTDVKGNITYANADFLKISGYQESEILGQQHNIVRHPDMPRVIFKFLWETIGNKREFNGYIKNLAKNGSYYWSFANITPTFSYDDEHQLLGYNLVCHKPNPDSLNYIQNLYIELLEIEKNSDSEDVIDDSRYKLNSVLNGREKGYDEFILSI